MRRILPQQEKRINAPAHPRIEPLSMVFCSHRRHPSTKRCAEHMTDSEFEQVRSFSCPRRTVWTWIRSAPCYECRLARERDRLQLPSFSAYFDLVESGRNQQSETGSSTSSPPITPTSCAKARSSSSSSPRLSRNCWPSGRTARGTYCAPVAHGRRMLHVSMLVGDYANPPDPLVRITGVDLSQPAIEEARTAISNRASPGCPVAGAMRTSFERSAAPLPSASARASFWRRATSATTKSCAGRTTSSCAETSSSTSSRSSQPVIATLHRHLAPSSYLVR